MNSTQASKTNNSFSNCSSLCKEDKMTEQSTPVSPEGEEVIWYFSSEQIDIDCLDFDFKISERKRKAKKNKDTKLTMNYNS